MEIASSELSCLSVCLSLSLSLSLSQLETRVSDLSREKSDLESRVEEDQDEIEELTGKQRALISQNTQLQTQLSEANVRAAELEDSNQNLEAKVRRKGGEGGGRRESCEKVGRVGGGGYL